MMMLKTGDLKKFILELTDDIRGFIFEMYFMISSWKIKYILITTKRIESNKMILISQIRFRKTR